MLNAINRIKTNILIIKANKLSSKISEKSDKVHFIEKTNYVTEIVLDNQKSLNSFTFDMEKILLSVWGNWVKNDDKYLVSDRILDQKFSQKIPIVTIFRGAGTKAFAAGGDVVSIYHDKKANKDPKTIGEFFRIEFLMDLVVSRMIPIQVSLWDGFVMGGGVGISINSPIRIATEKTVFAMPETKIGLIPDVGGTYFLPRIFNNNQSVGLYVGMTGERITGKDLVRCGVATHFVPSKNLEDLARKICEKTNENTSLNQIKEICKEFSEEIYDRNSFDFKNLNLINQVFKYDSVKNIFKRLKELAENSSDQVSSQWASSTLRTLNSYSPISLYLTFEQLNFGIKDITLEQAYQYEINVIYKILERDEFTEGIRAALIMRDNKPNWKYKSIEEIDENQLKKEYFE